MHLSSEKLVSKVGVSEFKLYHYSLAKKKAAAEESKPRLTHGGNLKLEKSMDSLRSKVNSMTGGALSRLKLKMEKEVAVEIAADDNNFQSVEQQRGGNQSLMMSQVQSQKSVRFHVKGMVEAGAGARAAVGLCRLNQVDP